MKNILFFVLIVCLPVIAFFEYQNYRKHHAPSAYSYETAADIDLNFYDAGVVKSYYKDAVEMAGFGKYCWKEFEVDVTTDNPQAPEKRVLVDTYQQMKASLMQTEQTLKNSQKLKDKGLDNATIKKMMENGWTENQYRLYQILGEEPYLEKEDQGANVLFVQKRLYTLGYELEVDGYFRKETTTAVKDFQKANGMFASGKIDDLTLTKLMKDQ